jgi:hypothetical protein
VPQHKTVESRTPGTTVQAFGHRLVRKYHNHNRFHTPDCVTRSSHHHHTTTKPAIRFFFGEAREVILSRLGFDSDKVDLDEDYTLKSDDD